MEQQWLPSDLARWLRRRSKIRRARETGAVVSLEDTDFYSPDYDPIDPRDARPVRGCLTVAVAFIVVAFAGFFIIRALTGGDEGIIGSPPVTTGTTTVATGAPPSSVTPSSAAPPTTQRPSDVIDDRTLLDILFAIGVSPFDDAVIAETLDLLDDLIDSIKENTPAYQGRDVDIARILGFLARMSLPTLDRAFNDSIYECGDTDPVVACPLGVVDMAEGDVVVVAMQVAAPIPTASPDRSYRYSVVFDTDGDPANDWVFVPPFEWDYFRGTDRWYQAVYDHVAGRWFVEVTQLGATGSTTGSPPVSAARFVVSGEWGVWFIPTNELGGVPAGFRVSAFAHDGTFGEATRGGDVSGADPTEPLIVFPDEPAVVYGE